MNLLKQKITAKFPRLRKGMPQGFALISTVMITSFLAILSLGLLSMSSVESKTTRQGAAMQEARANARLALQIAMAELQENVGADQRVTATAAILDAQPSTTTVEQVNHPHWTGVWSSTDDAGEPLIFRNDLGETSLQAAGLIDKRTLSGQIWDTPENKQLAVKKWLVSQPLEQGSALDPRTHPLDPAKMALMVSARGSANPVLAPTVKIESGSQKGGYAWWVGDEGVKARIAIDHGLATKSPDTTKPDEGFAWLQSAPGVNLAAIDPNWQGIDDEVAKIASLGTTKLASEGFHKDYHHDYTVDSEGLLVDTLRGGLRKDLSAYLLEGDQPGIPNHSAGLDDTSRLVGPLDPVDADLAKIQWSDTKHQKMAPRFGLLRTWLQTAEQAHQNGNEVAITYPNYAKISEDAFINNRLYDLQNQTKAGLKPYLVEGAVYYNFTHQPASAGVGYKIRTHVFPRVMLWNPYNTTIKTKEMVVYVRVMGNRVVEITEGDNTKKNVKLHLPHLPGAKYGAAVTRGSFVFVLEPTTFEPGECLVFSKQANGSSAYQQDLVSNNVLSASVAPGTQNFYVDDAISKTYTTAPKAFRFEEGGTIEDLSLDLKVYPGGNPGSFNSVATRNDWVSIQKVNYHFAYGDGKNPETGTGWRTQDARQIVSTAVGELDAPYYKTRDGARMRWLQETQSNTMHVASAPAFHETSPFVNHNFHANVFMRTPQDSMFGALEPKVFGSFVRDVSDAALEWSSSGPLPLPTGKFGGNPLGSPQDWFREKYVMFELPHPELGVTSLAQFQHAPVSALAWQPSSPVGNSWASALAPAQGTAPVWTSFGGWNSSMLERNARAVQARDLLQLNAFGHTGNQARGSEPDQLMHDLSYEINHSLWDRFYLTGNTTTEVQQFVTSSDPDKRLKNARLQAHRPTTSTAQVGYHHSAKQLSIIGAFNVNSTSVEAWKALLLATYNKSPDQDAEAKNRAVFPRVLLSEEGPADSAKPDDAAAGSGDAWVGYRSLDKDEVTLLAEKLVEQVKLRGPFISLSDFVNRRLVDDETGRMGALQAAIDAAGINQAHDSVELEHQQPSNGGGVTARERHEAKPMHRSAGGPNYLQAADILQPLGPSLAARSDTFVIRAYGESLDAAGNVVAKAWCEAVVQRTSQPITADSEGLDPAAVADPNRDLGRRFITKKFRWLNEAEL